MAKPHPAADGFFREFAHWPLLRRCRVLATLAIGCAPTFAQGAVTYLDQGWTDAEKQWWYTASQGSRLVPLSWLTALEQRDSTDKFLSDANVRKLGYLPDGTTGSALPLGIRG